jgi:hypothetical protein
MPPQEPTNDDEQQGIGPNLSPFQAPALLNELMRQRELSRAVSEKAEKIARRGRMGFFGPRLTPQGMFVAKELARTSGLRGAFIDEILTPRQVDTQTSNPLFGDPTTMTTEPEFIESSTVRSPFQAVLGPEQNATPQELSMFRQANVGQAPGISQQEQVQGQRRQIGEALTAAQSADFVIQGNQAITNELRAQADLLFRQTQHEQVLRARSADEAEFEKNKREFLDSQIQRAQSFIDPFVENRSITDPGTALQMMGRFIAVNMAAGGDPMTGLFAGQGLGLIPTTGAQRAPAPDPFTYTVEEFDRLTDVMPVQLALQAKQKIAELGLASGVQGQLRVEDILNNNELMNIFTEAFPQLAGQPRTSPGFKEFFGNIINRMLGRTPHDPSQQTAPVVGGGGGQQFFTPGGEPPATPASSIAPTGQQTFGAGQQSIMAADDATLRNFLLSDEATSALDAFEMEISPDVVDNADLGRLRQDAFTVFQLTGMTPESVARTATIQGAGQLAGGAGLGAPAPQQPGAGIQGPQQGPQQPPAQPQPQQAPQQAPAGFLLQALGAQGAGQLPGAEQALEALQPHMADLERAVIEGTVNINQVLSAFKAAAREITKADKLTPQQQQFLPQRIQGHFEQLLRQSRLRGIGQGFQDFGKSILKSATEGPATGRERQ